MLFTETDFKNPLAGFALQRLLQAPTPPWQRHRTPDSAPRAWSDLRAWALGLSAGLRALAEGGAPRGWALEAPAPWAGAAEDALRWAGVQPWWPEATAQGTHFEQAPQVRPALRSATLLPDVAPELSAEQFERWLRKSEMHWALVAGASVPKGALLELVERLKRELAPGSAVVLSARPALLGALEAALERAGFCVWHPAEGSVARGQGTWVGAWQRGLGLVKNALPAQGKGVSDLHLAQALSDADLVALGTGREPRELALQRCLQQWQALSSAAPATPVALAAPVAPTAPALPLPPTWQTAPEAPVPDVHHAVIDAWLGEGWQAALAALGTGGELGQTETSTLAQCLKEAGEPPVFEKSPAAFDLSPLFEVWTTLCNRASHPVESVDLLYLGALLRTPQEANLCRGQTKVSSLAAVRQALARQR